ncbi:NAD(P)/FAD-dependent oxidoreductase [Aggregatimonas sangjinii]|uniref:NAD(P)/FAD-dependent oxidoreductase n=1 Tax=Aggregatimonas sangjinii TaxID=2583587 RepID=A0A5B7SSI3_9FLAO|nr:NAD(P)/FAD-dependent oxidoreductase [Aggregatimonas sangjinii]QCW99972.1 NAD(P)/FAD-dependent oxidoreductase [Aggregatimonas sangjinii]
MKKPYDVLIIGGGLAGLTAAIHLAGKGRSVCVFEKEAYPRHKVCGEYVSNEVIPYLESLQIFLSDTSVAIDTLLLSTREGRFTELELPLGGIGISRYAFDELLYKKALAVGVEFVFHSITSVTFQNDSFECTDAQNQAYLGQIAIGAFGKRSNIDKRLNRKFMRQPSSWLGVKCHYDYPDFPKNKVALHNFKGGYGGLSKTETGAVNFCYLTSYESFKHYKDILNFNNKVISQNPFLGDFLRDATPIFEAPLTIAQISFESKKAVVNHMLMCGDAAGLIHPLCGNGMAMAIHSAKIAAEHVLHYFDCKDVDRSDLEMAYTSTWNTNFERRLNRGRQLQSILLNESLSNVAMATLAKSSWLLQKLIAQTHGKPIIC